MSHALIIDDDRGNLGVLKQLLTMEQITYTALHDSTLVQDVLDEGKSIDVVILDLGMPNLNGYQVFDLIQQYPHMAQVPVVACTVHTGEAQAARQTGFHSFLSKPLDIDQFGTQLQRILSGEAIWQAY